MNSTQMNAIHSLAHKIACFYLYISTGSLLQESISGAVDDLFIHATNLSGNIFFKNDQISLDILSCRFETKQSVYFTHVEIKSFIPHDNIK